MAIVVTLLGALGAGWVALGMTRQLAAGRQARIARRAVLLLAGLAGAEIATQLLELIRQLQANTGVVVRQFAATGALDAVSVALAYRYVFFFGGVLIGLAAIVAAGAMRRYPSS